MKPQGSSRKSAQRSLVVHHSLVGLRHRVTQEAVRRASRRSFLKKKARLGNSTRGSSISDDICMDVETEEVENKEQGDAPQMVTEPANTENRRVTRSMTRTSERDVSGGSKSKGDGRLTRSGSKRLTAQEINTTKKKQFPPKKCLTLRVERLAEEKPKRKLATKRQKEAARQKKLQQDEEEERRHQELLAKHKADEEREKVHKLTEAARALELKKEQERKKEERKRERQRERQAADEKERLEKEKAIALQKELERAAREKERREMEEYQKAQQKHAVVATASALVPSTVTEQNSVIDSPNKTIDHGPGLNVTVDIENSVIDSPNKTIDHRPGLNVTVDIEQSPQSYQITPEGQKDDGSAPAKHIPSWAKDMQAIMEQCQNLTLDLDSYFGEPETPKLEEIFGCTKSCYFKRTSSADWDSSPCSGNLAKKEDQRKACRTLVLFVERDEFGHLVCLWRRPKAAKANISNGFLTYYSISAPQYQPFQKLPHLCLSLCSQSFTTSFQS